MWPANDNGRQPEAASFPLIRYATVCSGIEGVSVAWEPLGGFAPVFFSEIAQFPKALLAHRFPDVPDLGDCTSIRGGFWRGKVDVLWGSTPCQAFSLTGAQRSLNDPRGRLTLAFADLADSIGPEILCWENVPHALRSNDNAFGCFLGRLVGLGSAVFPTTGATWGRAGCIVGPRRTAAWRVLDAQYGGLAARRERLFLVAAPHGGADPRDILFERSVGRGHPQAGHGARGPRLRQAERTNPFTGRPTSVDGPHAFNADTSPKWSDDLGLTLRADSASGGFQGIAVRGSDGRLRAFRLTAEMRERLLGFEPGWTDIPWVGRGRLEVARCAALGNSLAIPDVRWIGRRIQAAMTGSLARTSWPDLGHQPFAQAA